MKKTNVKLEELVNTVSEVKNIIDQINDKLYIEIIQNYISELET